MEVSRASLSLSRRERERRSLSERREEISLSWVSTRDSKRERVWWRS
jgi:hypothetical protein